MSENPNTNPSAERSELVEKLRLDRHAGRTSRTRSPRRGRWLVAAAVVAALVLAWAVFGRESAPLVETAVARAAGGPSGETSVLDASGYVTARRQATVSAKITGKVIEVLIEEGMRVEEGAVLARLDATEAQAALGLARAQLAAAQSEVAEVRAQLEQAEREFVRQRTLTEKRASSVQSLDAARAQRDTLRARLANTGDQIKVAEESVAVAQVQLDNTEVRAPFAGVVVAKAAQPGEMISPVSAGGGFTRTGIGTIVDMDSLEIEVDVNESFINRVSAGQPVEATLNAYPDWKIPAKVIAVIPTADRSKATVKVRVAIEAKDPRIIPDMGVRVAFLNPRAENSHTDADAEAGKGVLVPSAAVRSEGSERVAYVYAEGKVQRRLLTVQSTVGADTHVTSGVTGGERVIVSPPDTLEDGDAVRIAETG